MSLAVCAALGAQRENGLRREKNRNIQKQTFHRGNNGVQYQIQHTALSNIGPKAPLKQAVAINTRHEQHND